MKYSTLLSPVAFFKSFVFSIYIGMCIGNGLVDIKSVVELYKNYFSVIDLEDKERRKE